jgi:hypothetical protein
MARAELRKVGDLYEVIVATSEHDRRYMGNACTTPEAAKTHALNTARNLNADAQARLLKAQSDAISARETVESIQALEISDVQLVPKGWDRV